MQSSHGALLNKVSAHLSAQGADPVAQDSAGDTPLHFAAVHGQPMCAYTVAKVGTAFF